MANEIQHGDEQNRLGSPYGQPNYSRFPIKGHRFTTESFGRIDVCGVFNAIEADKTSWLPSHEITSYTMNAPLMQPLFKEKDYILVCRCAILPFNWDKIHVQPNIGQDIDASLYGTSVKATTWAAFMQSPKTIMAVANAYASYDVDDPYADTLNALINAIRAIILGEYIFSYGSLLTKCGAKFAPIFHDKDNNNYDDYFDWVIKEIFTDIYAFKVEFGDNEYIVNIKLDKDYLDNKEITIDEFLDRARENPGDFEIKELYGSIGETINTTDIAWNATADRVQNAYTQMNDYASVYTKPVDIARLWAYQLAVAEYMTNNHVDYIYSAELFRQLVHAHEIQANALFNSGIAEEETISYNGLTIPIDYLSAYYFGYYVSNILGRIDPDDLGSSYDFVIEYMRYMSLLFALRRSLKYMDYFVGSKTQPLAVGDVKINPDAGGKINVIDVTRKSQAYKFYNAIARIGRKAEDYSLEIMGVKQKHDWHVPLWLGATRSAVQANITDNTGEAQMTEANAQTSRFYGIEGKYKFDYEFDRDAIVIGLTYYDLERCYGNGVHRSFMHVNRFDMYNPFMQYTGDQEIYGEEYDARATDTFGYVPAYEEFKQVYNEVDGGFMTKLPGYAFVDGLMENTRNAAATLEDKKIGPDFIRSKPTELDRFYKSLTGHSLANRFHFIVDYYNEIDAKRRMAFNPGVGL